MDLQLGLFDEAPSALPRAVEGTPATDGHRKLARRLPAGLRLGTSSWTFPGWAGIVYDRPVAQTVLARDGLAAYAAHPLLRTVGLDRTYYRPVSAEEFRELSDSVPDDFRFLVKADRLLTSPVDPGTFGVREPNPRFLDARYAAREVVEPMMEGLGSKAGPLLFQFSPIPPNLVGGTGPFLERLHGFLERLPEGPSYAVELRTPGFLTREYVQILEATGTAHCFNVHPAMASLERQLSLLQPYQQPVLVVRWMLHAGLGYEAAKDRYEPFDRIVDADDESLDRITRAVFDALLAERSAYVVVNNKAEGSAPLTVFRLAERVAGGEANSTLDG
jgi:uncharacterized protein YecE (DUF72 family)